MVSNSKQRVARPDVGQWAQPQRKRVPSVQFVFVVQSTVERRRTAAILLVVEVVADLPGMVETMRAVS